MGNWNDVKGFLNTNYNIEELDANTVRFGFRYTDDLDRTQQVVVAGSDSLLEIKSPIATMAQVDGGRLLAVAAQQGAPGGLWLDGDTYVWCATMATETLQGPELLAFVELVARAADETEKALGLGDNF